MHHSLYTLQCSKFLHLFIKQMTIRLCRNVTKNIITKVLMSPTLASVLFTQDIQRELTSRTNNLDKFLLIFQKGP